MWRGSHRRWYSCRQARSSPRTPALGALWSARRMRHSPALERGAGDLRAVVRLPRGMSPFQLSRATVRLGQQRDAVESRPDGGSHIDHSLSPSTTVEGAPSSSAQPSEQLAPWPVDAFEFNAVAAHGGHDVRLAWDAIFSSSDSATADASGNESATSTLTGAGAVRDATSSLLDTASRTIPKLSLVTLDTIRQLKIAEETAEAQAALRGGGWVCTGCWAIVRADCSDNTSSGASDSTGLSSFPRTICPACRTLRHDARMWSCTVSLRRRPDLWQCRCCGEANTRAAANCRCCGVARSASIDTANDDQEEAFVRMTIAVEVDSYPIGHVVVTRNRTTRWRCGACREVNSLQMAVCRHCARERFAVTVSCPTCDAPRVLSNAVVLGGGGADAHLTRGSDSHAVLDTVSPSSAGTADASGGGHTATPHPSARVFGPENCYSPNSTQLTCLQCRSPLHGGRVTTVSATPSWWCACGVVNTMTAYSCVRCRLPRALECPEKLRALLRSAVADSVSASPPLPAQDPGAAPDCSEASPKWDFRSCTNWMCDSCCGVNTASYQVVAESSLSSFSDAACPDHTKRGRRLWMRHGDAECRHCGAPWHHQVLLESNSWRCACHALNSRADAFCTSCGLPALDGVRPDMLSSWSKGDWRCPSCGSLCYRSRQRCSCGTPRPPARLGGAT
ncbi:conserved hypothetical protein [Leishmania major strain Friedlin]|uniref:RanBP2-type domain-containing protein n=1 Tax=Leishmania major TaxID=5664 RepID=Q4QCB8_LEIMA|nr:conserved hypothetical protein [Leishmania major strain Friedlin]CAG9573423.1 hypothetical_protein_-_conserved [Leishmania major strain Friedlin]CAJ04350.1 conserved hypothetical protein [Leishmania major strain Friedlin]|eukprot:XP_001683030.1 conserved hypothetical protein [Leishmania major strain Friedlin]